MGLADFAGSKFQRVAKWSRFDQFSRGVYCSGIGHAGSKFQRMANWPSFDQFFERSLLYVLIVGLANFAGSKSQRMTNWPSFDHFSRGVYSGNDRFCRLATPTDGQLASFDFTCSKFQRMANWPSFDFLIETGPVGHPLEFRACKSAKPTIDSSRKSQISH